MIVYLDSAQLFDLERADAVTRARFINDWRNAGAELAVSIHHLQEAAQDTDEQGLANWFTMLRQFHSVRCAFASSATVMSLETQVQLFALLNCSVDTQRSGVETLFRSESVDAIEWRTMSMHASFRRMRAIHRLEAEAHELSKRTTRQHPGIGWRRKVHLERLEKLDPVTILESADMPNLEEGRTLRSILRRVWEVLCTVGTVRGTLERLYGLADMHHLANLADEDLSAAAVFFSTGREQVDAVAHRVGRPRATIMALTKSLDPYAAPGFSLQLAVQRGLRTHPRLEEPGNQIDVAHLSFAPYVDLLFVDRHTLGLIRQERESRPERVSVTAGQNIVCAANLDSVIHAMQTHNDKA
jgi:hypothetical protein